MNKKAANWKIIMPYCFIILCAIIMALNATNTPFQIGNTEIDSSVFNYIARVIRQGGMPYRDSFDHKGPLIYLIDLLGILINQKIGVWLMELVSIFITFLFAYKIARFLDCNKICSCLVVAITYLSLTHFFEGGNLTEEYACPLIMVSLFIFLRFFKNGNVKLWELIICGMSFCAVCLLRVNMVAMWGVMCISVLIDRIKAKRAKDVIGFIAWFILGIVIVAGPIMVWLIKNNSFQNFVEDYLSFNFMYNGPHVKTTSKK